MKKKQQWSINLRELQQWVVNSEDFRFLCKGLSVVQEFDIASQVSLITPGFSECREG